MVIAGALLLYFGFIAAVDLPRNLPTPQPPLPQWGVPVLAHVPRDPPSLQSRTEDTQPRPVEALQSLASGIGQGVTEHGSIILFTPLNDRVRIESVVAELGRYYARSGDSVLVFDARAAHAKRLVTQAVTPVRSAQVDAYLDGHTDDADTCFAPTEVPALEYTRGDLTRRVNDGMLGMYRFRKLLDDMRQRYSRVLMIAPALREAGDLDMLTALSEAVVLVVPDHTPADEVEPCVQSLRSAEAPLCGAVVVGEMAAV
jgi:hypothetical protein